MFLLPLVLGIGDELDPSAPSTQNMGPIVQMLAIVAVLGFIVISAPILSANLLFGWLKPEFH